MSTNRSEHRAEYMAACDEALSALEIRNDAISRLREAVASYGDPFDALTKLEANMPFDAPVVPTPAAPPELVAKQRPRKTKSFKQTSYPTRPLDDITVDLIRANPGRTVNQLKSALAHWEPETERFLADSLSPTISRLAMDGKLVRALCDTERRYKLYVMGEVPPGARVFDADFRAGGSLDDMEAATRAPNAKEIGGDPTAAFRAELRSIGGEAR